MATYNANIIRTAKPDTEDIATELEDITTEHDFNFGSSLISETSASFVSFRTKTLTGISTDDLIIAELEMCWSHDAAGLGRIATQIRIGTSTSGTMFDITRVSNVAGTEDALAIGHHATDLTGSIDVDFEWRRDGGGTTVFSSKRLMRIYVVKSGGLL